MCAIFGIFFVKGDYRTLRKQAIRMLRKLLPRGPDDTTLKHFQIGDYHFFIGHQRLSIVDPFHGEQPFYGQYKKSCVVTNGEIYNHLDIRKILKKEHTFKSNSDSEIVPHLYDEIDDIGVLCNHLSGMFASIIFDFEDQRLFVTRDHLGIIPCYLGRGSQGEVYVASELKAFHDHATNIEILLPGHYFDSKTMEQIRWYNPVFYQPNYLPTQKVELSGVRDRLIGSVKKLLMCDVPFGVLLSGGLDSSLISSITSRLYNEHKQNRPSEIAVNLPDLCSFCIGLEGSPDLKASREVANFLKTKHYEFVFTVEDGIDAISDVIYSLETFNPTTIRASTPMYLMSRKIKSLGIKMVLTGEGADEIFGGYLYFHKAPDSKEFHEETVRKIQDLYKYDLLRANKSTSAWGLEARPPFLDRDFMEYIMDVDPECKVVNKEHLGIEKWVLRKAFDDKENPWLPENILWRQKEQFSDGVGYNWIDGLKV